MICLINYNMMVQKVGHVMYSSGYISRKQWPDLYGRHTWSDTPVDTAHGMSDQPQHSGAEGQSCNVHWWLYLQMSMIKFTTGVLMIIA